MATQAAIFAETIVGMKKAVKRKAYDSDSDSSIEQMTNRGNKLRKKARYVHEGQLAPPTGPVVYKRKVKHAGFEREIISRNPPIIDEDGYEVDSDDDDERAQEAMAAAAELDPYSDVKIEHLLAPLTAASDLPGHPTLSKPFLSKTLTELTRQAGEMVQKEKASLWRIKHLLTRLSGDNTWITCESVEDQNDITLFEDERERHRGDQSTRSKDDGDHLSTGTLISDERAQTQITDFAHPGEAIPNSTKEKVPSSAVEGADGNAEVAEVADKFPEDTVMNDSKREDVVQGDRLVGANKVSPEGGTKEGAMDVDQPSSQPRLEENIDKEPVEGLDGVGIEGVPDDQEDLPAPHRMRTRAQAQAASDNTASRTRSMTPDSSAESFVHPYFLAPRSSHPDRDLGLPQHEADEIRRSLQLYIQKQEEICRGAQRVYEGLLKADRYRRSVMKWAKAEAHVGVNRDMSDGEDWYDKEEWGLEEDLKKGNDEEEEDAATTAKKTRTRRQ